MTLFRKAREILGIPPSAGDRGAVIRGIPNRPERSEYVTGAFILANDLDESDFEYFRTDANGVAFYRRKESKR